MRNRLRDNLFSSGLIEEGDSQKIRDFKTKYQKEQSAAYMKEYQKKNKRKTLVFSPEQFTYLQNQANKHNMKLSPFLSAVIFAYLESSFVFPDEKSLSSIEMLLREINQRVAESIQYVHMSQTVELSDLEQIKKRIQSLEYYISETLGNPPRLENWIEDQVKKDDMFLPKIHRAIGNYLSMKK